MTGTREVEELCARADEWASKQRGYRDGDDIERVETLATTLRALVAERDGFAGENAELVRRINDGTAHRIYCNGNHSEPIGGEGCICNPRRGEVAALAAERDELRAKAMGWESHASHVVEDNKALTAQLAAARADVERYKWWAQHPARVTYWDNDGEDFYRPCDAFGRITGPPMPLNAAIEAAKGGA